MLCSGHIRVFQVCNSLGSQHCRYTHRIRLYFGKPSMDQPHTWCPASAQHATCSRMMGLTPCAHSSGQRTTGFTTHALHRWSISVQEIPKIYIIYCNRPQMPYIWQITRCNMGWWDTHAPSQCSVYGTSTQAYLMLTLRCQKVYKYIPSEIGSFNITYPNNSSHFKMQNRSFEDQLLPGCVCRVGYGWLAQLLRSDLVSLVRYMPGTNANAELYQKRPFRRLVITPCPLLEICILKQSYTLNSSPMSK